MIYEQLLSFLPVFVTLVAAALAYWRYTVERRHKQRAFVNSLFGELGSLLEHYTYASAELVSDEVKIIKRRLAWSKYERLQFADDVSRFGFLSASEIQKLLQLYLRVRNSDLLCSALLAEIQETNNIPAGKELSELRGKMSYIKSTARVLLKALVEKEPKLKSTLDTMLGGPPFSNSN